MGTVNHQLMGSSGASDEMLLIYDGWLHIGSKVR
mgnify:CR=1 FL=1